VATRLVADWELAEFAGLASFLPLYRSFLVKVEDALGARKFCGAGACNGTLDPDLTLATIRQAQPGATLDEIHRRRGFLEPPRPGRIGTPGGAADRLDNAVALDYGRALADRRGAVVAILDPHTIGRTDMKNAAG
jgi:hypothetical protein